MAPVWVWAVTAYVFVGLLLTAVGVTNNRLRMTAHEVVISGVVLCLFWPLVFIGGLFFDYRKIRQGLNRKIRESKESKP